MIEIIQTILILLIVGLLVNKELPKLKTDKLKKEYFALLDSCALIDGRIVELAKTGFVPQNLAVPEFILAELQLLADGNDSHKRERARFGLEVVQQLQKEALVNITVERTSVQANNTDDKLVKLAKKINAQLVTTDYNLNQVASIEGVKVLNVNELMHALRPVALPGDDFEVKVLQSGSNKDQGVGYLEDGTMIVVDNARKDIGKRVKVQITRTHQTVAGKMLFAQKVEQSNAIRSPYKNNENKTVYNNNSKNARSPRSVYKKPNNTKSGANRHEKLLLKAVNEASSRLRERK